MTTSINSERKILNETDLALRAMFPEAFESPIVISKKKRLYGLLPDKQTILMPGEPKTVEEKLALIEAESQTLEETTNLLRQQQSSIDKAIDDNLVKMNQLRRDGELIVELNHPEVEASEVTTIAPVINTVILDDDIMPILSPEKVTRAEQYQKKKKYK